MISNAIYENATRGIHAYPAAPADANTRKLSDSTRGQRLLAAGAPLRQQLTPGPEGLSTAQPTR